MTEYKKGDVPFSVELILSSKGKTVFQLKKIIDSFLKIGTSFFDDISAGLK